MRRVKYNRGNLESTKKAARKILNGSTLYIFATYNGYAIDSRKPPFNQPFVEIKEQKEYADKR